MVAIRGTVTMEDVVTDSLAEPVLLHNTEWLPKRLRAHQQKTGGRSKSKCAAGSSTAHQVPSGRSCLWLPTACLRALIVCQHLA